MRFAKWVFLLAGVAGILLVVPPYFLEPQTGEDYPPAITHPEYYYGSKVPRSGTSLMLEL
jgi:hypothetical protein